MAKSKKKIKKTYIFQWPFKSSKETAGGRRASYAVLLTDTGELSCDCPGWVFWRNKAKARTCKHIEHPEVAKNYKKYIKMHQQGEALPQLETSDGDVAFAATVAVSNLNSASTIAFGRYIMLDD